MNLPWLIVGVRRSHDGVTAIFVRHLFAHRLMMDRVASSLIGQKSLV
jgi:hypothetical protein